ncbi:MAG: protein translocase subunit SecF [Candidatus Altiarchaeota archaeon]|nr:protein translocase subunit SecF [Candidatus Altiarchaeota archaeon]
MFDDIYSKIISKADYRILTAIPPLFAVLMLFVFLVNGVSYGLEFQGGTWVEVSTNKTLSHETLSEIKSNLVSDGLSDVQVYETSGIGSSDNTLTIVTTSVVDDKKAAGLLSSYFGELRPNDIGTVVLGKTPPADFVDKVRSRFTHMDVSVNGTVVKFVSLELDSAELDSAVEYYLGEKVDLSVQKRNLDVRSVGPTLGKTFREQGIKAIFFSFILMSIVVFLAFKEVIPSIAVMQAAVNDVLITLGCMSLLGIPFDSASLGALLMIIGYSVDTDILLTTRVLKRKGWTVNESIDSGVKTGLMMNSTTIAVMCVTIIVTTFFIQIATLKTIATVLFFGIVGDVFTTFLTNAGLLKWLVESKVKKGVHKR